MTDSTDGLMQRLARLEALMERLVERITPEELDGAMDDQLRRKQSRSAAGAPSEGLSCQYSKLLTRGRTS